MLAAVVPFALETGLVTARGDTSTLRVLTLNTDMVRGPRQPATAYTHYPPFAKCPAG